MFRVNFTAKLSRTIKTRCWVCREGIKKNDINIHIYHMNGSENYHLDCYTPKVKQYICESDISVYLKDEDAKKFYAWLEKWNQNYAPIDKPYHAPLNLIKQVESTPSKYRRAWIEVFRFISPWEVSRTLTLVCREFYHITWDEELWHFYYVKEFNDPEEQCSKWKDKYISMAFQGCIGCHKILTDQNFYRCPMLKKPLCWNCREKTHKFRLLNKSDIKLKYGVNANLLNLKFHEGSWNTKKSYTFMVKKALDEYHNLNKQKLLKKFEKDPDYNELKEIADSINIRKIHKEILPDEKFIANPFYHCFDKILKYIRNKEGGFKDIKPLNN
ncbi:unnamed protein product [Blepharisma stoltei]|uniref:Uncharacterized protein n=1 Tax=Blepharisma stoltei TaxID=1481888 RepID=A0AAU9KBY6_9CILI|nr:unnamed protein product [Blepharisma stoltei]